jgi:hypothetical protein
MMKYIIIIIDFAYAHTYTCYTADSAVLFGVYIVLR